MNRADLRAALLRVVVGRPGSVVPESDTLSIWTAAAQFERVIPALYHLVDTTPTDLTDDDRGTVAQLQRTVLSSCVRLEHRLIEATRVLGAHGIRSAVLKGAATAHLDYPDPSWRQFNDIDVLVDPADRGRATAALQAEGWVQGYALPRGHEDYAHAVTFMREGVELDLHQRIGRRALGELVPARLLFERAVPFEIAGAQMRALDETDRLIHAAMHAVAARAPLRTLSTLTDVLVAADGRPDLAAEILARAEQRRVRSLVERGVRDAYAAARLDLHPEWVDAMRRPIRRRDRLVDIAYATPTWRPVAEELAYLRRLRGLGNRWRYVRGYFTANGEGARQSAGTGLRAQVQYVLAKLRSRPR